MDMEEGLAKGNLSFRLSGKKLKGDFSLVRFKGSCIFRAIATGIPTRLRPLFRFDHDRQSGGFTTGVPEHCDRLN
jgi:hypothetical protein